MDVFQKRVNVHEHTVKMALPGRVHDKNMERKLKENYLRFILDILSRGQDEFIDKFKMAVGDVISIRGRL